MKTRSVKIVDAAFVLLITLLSAVVFYRLFNNSDMRLHAAFAAEYIKTGNLPGNFLYYFIISVIAFKNTGLLMVSTIVALSFFVLLKFIVTKNLLQYETKNTYKALQYNTLAFCLIIITAIYIPQLFFGRFYLGSFTPNVWHNSTTIAVMPFAILLYGLTIKQINNFSTKRLVYIIFLIFINLAIKPSYLFVFVGALPLTYWYVNRPFKLISKNNLLQLLPVIIAIVLIFLQKSIIYEHTTIYTNSSVEISLLKTYRLWLKLNMFYAFIILLISLATSILYPLFVLIKKGVTKNDTGLIFAWVSFFGAMLIFLFFNETGERLWHGNFIWQVYICSYILFLVSVLKTLPELTKSLRKPNLFQILLLLHVIFGAVYVSKIIIFKSCV